MPRDKAHARMPKTRSKRGREAGPEHTVLEAHLLEAGEAGEEAGGEEAAAPKARRVGFDLGSAVEPEGGGSSGQPLPVAARAEPLGEAPQHGEGGGGAFGSAKAPSHGQEQQHAAHRVSASLSHPPTQLSWNPVKRF